MMDSEDKKIDIEGVDPRELYGPQNIYLEQMQELHPNLKIIARGSALTVLGPRSDSEQFRKRLDGLIAYYLKYGYISKESVQQAFSTGVIEHDAPVDKDVIVYGNNGTIVRARTVNQLKLVQSYDRNDLLLAIGPAGSGKTYTAIALAVRALKEKHVKRIILTRPAVEAGEKLGFLPGDMKARSLSATSLCDALSDMIPPAKLQKAIEEDRADRAAGYMRGRCARQQLFVIYLDEAGNTTLPESKMFLTRMGRNAKFIVTGDVTQIDLPRRSDSGLTRAMEILRGVEGIGIVEFDRRDIVRHPLVKQIVEAFDRSAAHRSDTCSGNWKIETITIKIELLWIRMIDRFETRVGLEAFCRNRQNTPSFLPRGEDPCVRDRRGQESRPGVQGGCGPQCLCPQACLQRDGEPQRYRSAGASGYGSSEEQR